jgi:hypothetical protein
MITRLIWDDQKERFAEFILTNVFAVYESWGRHVISSERAFPLPMTYSL